ncbi:MAG: DEAD/DEAH box helicase [Archaeoglobus sp.]|nr:DEAD/DEAH box helicase [Archaeoglobus sp.]
MEYISHPFIKEKAIERRAYQVSIAATALIRNTLVVLPTGLGKTVIALYVIASRLLNLDGKALFLAPTKPLVEQHADFLRKNLRIDKEEIIALSGENPPEQREALYKKARVIVATPQVIENDIVARRFSLKDVIHLTFDEAHRAVGNYSYVFIAKRYLEEVENPLILGITASPGSDIERISEVVENLGIEEIEIRTEYDSDVRPYIHERKIDWIKVDMPAELKEVREKFEKAIKLRFKKLESLGFAASPELSKRELLALQEAMHAEAMESKDPSIFEAISVMAEILKISHGIELIETQGIEAVKNYLRRLIKEGKARGGSKAAKNLLSDAVFREAMLKALSCKVDHPKLEKLKEIISKEIKKDTRIIVFCSYRDTAETLVNELGKIDGVRASKFIGQSNRVDDKGMRQREQVEVVSKFREGQINVLIATSIGEEGLDIPATDLVVFYEAVPSEIRAIQRKGRTGRTRKGKIIVLMTKGTRDEAYYWSSLRKEKLMYDQIYRIRENLRKREQVTLFDFEKSEKPEAKETKNLLIYVDSREMKSGVVKELYSKAELKIKNLEVADYVLSDRVAVERKTAEDFINSLIKGERDLFSQLLSLRKSYLRPLLIIEGELYGRIHPNAIRGALAAIVVDLGIPVIQTKSQQETAEILLAIAKREQEIKSREITLHSGKTKRSLKEQQEYIVSAISNIGPVIARNLLKHFKTIENIVNASEEDLVKVPKVGKKTARKIKEVLTTPYEEDSD